MKKFFALLKVSVKSMLLSSSNMGRKNRKKAATGVGVVLLIAGLGLYMSGLYSSMLMQVLAPLQMEVLVFVFMGMGALVGGMLFTAFAAKGVVFGGKDNDLLLSMPVSTTALMASRVTAIYLENLVFSFFILVPAGVVCAVMTQSGAGHNPLFWVRLLLAVLVCVYPFLYVVSVALSSGEAVNKGLVTLLPVDLNLDAMKTVLKYEQLWISYGNTIFYTIVGTILNVAFTCLAAYPLSKRTFCFRKPLNFLLAFTMYFSGGLIPIYIVVTSLGLYNKRLAMLVPVLVSAYNVMICRSAFESISDELFEEAELEGANDFLIMHKIAIPLIKPTLAVLTLYYAVARYNDFFNAMLYISDKKLEPLQLFLRRILLEASTEIMQTTSISMAAASQSTLQVRYVCIVVSVVPIMLVVPFVQKYLVEGTMLGAVKG